MPRKLRTGSLVGMALPGPKIKGLGMLDEAVEGIGAVGRVGGAADDIIKGGVYELVDKDGIPRYVGQTCDFMRRFAEHAADPRINGLRQRPVVRSPDKIERMIYGQQLIEEYRGKGIQLINKISAISKKNPFYYFVR